MTTGFKTNRGPYMDEHEQSSEKKKDGIEWMARTSKNTIAIAILILVVLSIIFTLLTSRGILNIGPYTSWLRSVFGNTFGG
jgi:hypothetical protein